MDSGKLNFGAKNFSDQAENNYAVALTFLALTVD